MSSKPRDPISPIATPTVAALLSAKQKEERKEEGSEDILDLDAILLKVAENTTEVRKDFSDEFRGEESSSVATPKSGSSPKADAPAPAPTPTFNPVSPLAPNSRKK